MIQLGAGAINLTTILTSIILTVAIATIIKLSSGGSTNFSLSQLIELLAQSLIPQLVFISLMMITKGDIKLVKVNIEDKATIYGASILNGIFGRWIFKKFVSTDKKINIFDFILKVLIRSIPGLDNETKENIIIDLEKTKKEKQKVIKDDEGEA